MKRKLKNQLCIFQQHENELKDIKLTTAANEILAAVNDGMKVIYKPHAYFQEGNYIVLMAVNKFKESIFNILDLDGNVPQEFGLCWRNLSHIQNDLNNSQFLKLKNQQI